MAMPTIPPELVFNLQNQVAAKIRLEGEQRRGYRTRLRKFIRGDDNALMPMDLVSIHNHILIGNEDALEYIAGERYNTRGMSVRKVRYFNLSEHKVKVPDLGIDLAPGEGCDIPEAYAKWRGTRPPVIQELAPQLSPARIECQVCKILIGQVDESGAMVEWSHKAPCGLPCAGRGEDAHGGHDDVHHGQQQCSRCKRKKCPLCLGLGHSGYHYEKVPDIRGRYHQTEIRTKCTRCNGNAWVDGLELWLAEHGEAE